MSYDQNSQQNKNHPSAISELFDKALASQDERLFQGAFRMLDVWALRLTLVHISDISAARMLVQEALLAVYRKNNRCSLDGADIKRTVYTHLFGSKEAGFPGSIWKYLKSRGRKAKKLLSLEDPVTSCESLSLKDTIPDTAPDPIEVMTKVNRKKKQVQLLLESLDGEIFELKRKPKVNEAEVETLSAFYNYISAKVSGLKDNELADLQFCIVSVTKSQKILDRELSEYLQKALHLKQNSVRQRVNRYILKSPSILRAFGGNIKR